MKKGIKYSLLGLLAVIIIALTGASFYMLGYSLRPEYNKGKDIPGSYEYMLSEYPQIKPWIDSLQTVGALRDTFIINPEGLERPAGRIALDGHCQRYLRRKYPDGSTWHLYGCRHHYDGIR